MTEKKTELTRLTIEDGREGAECQPKWTTYRKALVQHSVQRRNFVFHAIPMHFDEVKVTTHL